MRQRWSAAAPAAAAGKHEGAERLQLGVHLVDLALEPRDLRRGDPEALAPVVLARRGEIGAEIEEVVLDARQHRVEFGRDREPRQPDMGIGLVDGADRREAEVGFRPPLAGAERRGAGVAGAGVDLVEDDHLSALAK